MKRAKSTIWVVVLILIFAANTEAEVITIFDSNATIADGNAYDTVVVKGDGTVVDMTGGDVNNLITMNASTFNMSGGNIAFKVYSYDSSVLNLSSGSTHRVYSYGESDVNISGDASITVEARFYNSAVLTISSNDATCGVLQFYMNSRFEMSGGSVDGAISYENSTLNITGGDLSEFIAWGGGNVNFSGGTAGYILAYLGNFTPIMVKLSGGNIAEISFYVREQAMPLQAEISIIGYSLIAVPYGGAYGYGQITGYWNDDTPFSIDLTGDEDYAFLALYDGVIPPNCTNRPMSDLSGDCKVNLIDFSKMAFEWLDCGLDPNEACQG